MVKFKISFWIVDKSAFNFYETDELPTVLTRQLAFNF